MDALESMVGLMVPQLPKFGRRNSAMKKGMTGGNPEPSKHKGQVENKNGDIYIYIFQHFITFAYTPTHQRGKKVSTSVLVSQSVSASISSQKKHGLCAMNAHGRACSCWRPKMAKKGRTFFGQLCPINVDF